MSSSLQLLTPTDIRGALRLANELHSMNAEPQRRRRHLVDGLCKLLEADVGLTLTSSHADGGKANGGSGGDGMAKDGQLSVVTVGWPEASDERSAARHFQDSCHTDPMYERIVEKMARDGQSLATCRRSDFFNATAWAAIPLVKRRREVLKIDECIVSMYAMPRTKTSAWIFLYRRVGDRPAFSRRDRELLHVIHSEMDWLYKPADAPVAHPEMNGLTERERQTLDRLLAGDSEKEAAAALGLSPHTVHVYVKALYRAFNVNTRNELLAKFVRSPGE